MRMDSPFPLLHADCESESGFKNEGEASRNVKPIFRPIYTLYLRKGFFNIDTKYIVTKVDNIDYVVVAVQLWVGGKVTFLFGVKELNAFGKPDVFSDPLVVLSYRRSSFLDPKGRDGSNT